MSAAGEEMAGEDPALETDEAALDAGPGRRTPARTCIVSRTAQAPDAMIRFVVDPDGAVVPDLRARLPGRGAWVGARRGLLEEAVRRRQFQRAFRGKASRVPDDLPTQVAGLMRADLRQALALANKAGCVVAGFGKVESAIGAEPGVAALLHAAEASPDGRRKLAGALHRRYGAAISAVPIIDDLSEDELDMALGRDHVIHAALVAGVGATGCLVRWRRLRSFEGADAAIEASGSAWGGDVGSPQGGA